MEIYDLGLVPWHQSQLVYHALARLGREAICICSPISPYFCLGYHQDIDLEVDLDFCAENNIPVFRREVGGGGVFLDSNQVFFQLIVHRRGPHATMRREALYRKFLEPVVNVYRSMGVPAHYRSVADLAIRNRKICGTGAGEIGNCVALVGNIILDFDFRMMSRILRVPDEGFRRRARMVMEENMTTVRREIGALAASKWDITRITAALVYEFEKVLGSLEPRNEDSELNGKTAELARTMMNDTWLHRKRKRVPGRTVTIRSGLQLVQESIESPAGVVTAQFEIRDGKFASVSILGESARPLGNEVTQLESFLEGVPVKEIRQEMSKLFADPDCRIAGLGRERWMRLLGGR